MRFSEAFNITRTDKDDWFDPHLNIDTALFIDPILLLNAGGKWAKAHKDLISHFAFCYELIGKAESPVSVSAQAAHKLLTFPEPYELGLGYTARGTKGAGSGVNFAARMVDGIAVAIAAGLTNPEHIEEIGILNEGIGADRISDATANIIKEQLIIYTQDIAKKHNILLDKHNIKNSKISLENARWFTEEVFLPTNPETGKPIILVPEFILNDLPILNAEDWFYSKINEDLRLSLNFQIGKKVPKKEIVKVARQHPDVVRKWAQEQTSRKDLSGYNFKDDPNGFIQWDKDPVQYAAKNPLPSRTVTTYAELIDLMTEIIEKFQHYIEQQRGWSLLWNDNGSEKPESAAQLLFLGFSQQYLRQFNVEIDREVELGRGPVDFKVSSGTSARLLIEVKKLHNGKFWNGLQDQLPSYLNSDDSKHGWFLALHYRDNKGAKKRINNISYKTTEIAKLSKKDIRFKVIDVRRPLSASKI